MQINKKAKSLYPAARWKRSTMKAGASTRRIIIKLKASKKVRTPIMYILNALAPAKTIPWMTLRRYWRMITTSWTIPGKKMSKLKRNLERRSQFLQLPKTTRSTLSFLRWWLAERVRRTISFLLWPENPRSSWSNLKWIKWKYQTAQKQHTLNL